ncbi:hypothetical protein ASF77_16870 [Massilia sp. Leaf139]|nr:hypothetical protein ASF77_16870 [Massilia sp. Leaf139]
MARVVDAPLFIVPRVLDALRAYREGAAPPLPGLDALTERLLAGVAAHPTKWWVLRQFQKTLDAVADDSLRVLLAVELERLMDILGIASSDGILGIDRR